jgi:hypothetical protein
MGKYGGGSFQAKQQQEMREARHRIHPIWRGVGLLLIVITPVLGYFSGLVLLAENAKQGWFMIPLEWLAPGADQLLFVKIGLTLVLGLLIFFIFQFLSMIIFRAFGPPRYGPFDVPPVAYKGKKRSR